MSQQTQAGGPGGGAGYRYQDRVAAYFAAAVLAEQGWAPVCGLPRDIGADWVQCEAPEPVDDILVHTSRDGYLFIQAKRSLRIATASDSPLGSALSQFIRQFRSGAPARGGRRSLDPERDRLLLVISARCLATVRVVLRDLLDHVRALQPGAPLASAAASSQQRDVLNRTLECVQSVWQAELNVAPTEEQIRELVGLMHALCLDVEPGGADERSAKELLRNVVLRDSGQADESWDLLVRTCADAATARSLMDRPALQNRLLQRSIDLRGVRSYQDRIETLRQRTRDTQDLTADLARIRVATDYVKIERECTQPLLEAAESESLLVIGEPGAGKSGVLHDLVARLLEDGRDVVYLTADWAADLGRDLVEVLENWPGVRPGFLVIDALDSVRSEGGARALREALALMMERETRWHVVASIRTFDLRHSPSLQERFQGEPYSENSTWRSDEFASVQHFKVPRIQSEEWERIREQSPALADLADRAPDALHELLNNLFNVRLAAELLGQGESVDQLAGIRTQIGLLDRYWQWRIVDEDGHGDARERLLRGAVEEMVRAKTLRVNRADLVPQAQGNSLQDVQSRNVLRSCSPGDDVLEFTHHILFDYAAARLLFRGTQERLINLLAEDPILALTIQPSLRLHFQHLWHAVETDRGAFWEVVFALVGASGVPEIGKLVGPSVAAGNAATLDDFNPLCSALGDATDTTGGRVQAFSHLVGSLVADDPTSRLLVGSQAGPWCALLRSVADGSVLAQTAGPAIILLSRLCEEEQQFTSPQAEDAGYAARTLMDFALSQEPRNEWQVVNTCRAVCRLFSTDTVASANLIRRGLGEDNTYTPHELYWLCREIEHLIPHDPDLVEEIYVFVFSSAGPSEDAQPYVTGRILPLSFGADQEWGMCQYNLVNSFPRLLRASPEQATRVAIRAVELHDAGRRARIDSGPGEVQTFDFFGRQARIRTDYSHIWARGHAHDDALALLSYFESYLDEIGRPQPVSPSVAEVVEAVVEFNEMAVFWCTLLRAGAQHPETVGSAVKPLAWAQPAFACLDTASEMGPFIGAVFRLLDEGERRRVEETILGIPDGARPEQREYRERARDWLLSRLPEDQLVTDAARTRGEELREAGEVAPIGPAVEIGPVRTVAFTTERFLESRGVSLEEPANQHILDLIEPVTEFCDRSAEEALGAEVLSDARQHLEALREALEHAETNNQVHPEQREYGWDYLALACGKICRADDPQPVSEHVCFARDTLLSASQRLHPEPQDNDSADFDLSWGSPAARIEAAEGLVPLARHADYLTEDVREAVRRLALADDCAAVRFQISHRLLCLYHSDQQLMWSLAEAIVAEEDSPGVLDGLVHGVLWQLREPHMDRVAGLTRDVLSRAIEGRRAGELRGECTALLFDLCVRHEHPIGSEVIEEIVRNPVGLEGSSTIIAGLRRLITLGPVEPPDEQKERVRACAWALGTRLTERLCQQLENLMGVPEESGEVMSDEVREQAQRTLRLLDGIANQLYFASGAFDSDRRPDDEPLTPAQRTRFFSESEDVFALLAGVGYPSITHHLLKTMESFAGDRDKAKQVFLRVGRAVDAGRRGGYEFESLAVDLIVNLVERYLAEQRQLIQEDSQCREVLLSIINTFVQAGWSSARRLVYRLEDVFR